MWVLDRCPGKQFHLSRLAIERVINEVRARRLLEVRVEFMSDPSFDDPAAVAELLGPFPGTGSNRQSRRSKAPQGLPSYLAGLYDVPLLSPEQERFLFRKTKPPTVTVHQLRSALDPDRCDIAVGRD